MRKNNPLSLALWGRPEPHLWTNQLSSTVGTTRAVAWSPKLALFVRVGYSQGYHTGSDRASIQSSEDGKTWTTQVSNVLIDGHKSIVWVSWLNGGSFVVSTAGSPGVGLLTSVDGVTWEFTDTSVSVGAVSGFLCATSTTLVLVDAAGITAYRTTDLITWASSTIANIVFFVDSCTPIVWNGTALVAVGLDNTTGAGKCATSTDHGATWTARTIPDRYWNSVCYNEKLAMLAACAKDGPLGAASTTLIATSTDHGVTWTSRTSGTHPYTAIAAAGVDADYPWFCAVAGTLAGEGGKDALTSADGLTWSANTPSFAKDIMTGVVWSVPLELFVAVGYEDTGYTSDVATSTKGT